MDSKEKLKNALEEMFLNDARCTVTEEMKKNFSSSGDIFETEHKVGDKVIPLYIQTIDRSIPYAPVSVKWKLLNSKNIDKVINEYKFVRVTGGSLIVKEIKE